MTKQKLLGILIGIMLTGSLHAQDKAGKISGTIHAANNVLISSATVQLLKEPSKKTVKIIAVDKAGNYAFENISKGNYSLLFTALGYENKAVAPFSVSASKPLVEIPPVQLAVQKKTLAAVTVVSNKPFIEQKIDRMVVNVDASPTNAGATALEVLEKSPGVTVDNDGNISLKGKAGVIVMMDGKPTYLSAADLANVLRNLPASALDRIEIMTNPSSKYDAAGNSGIVDIKTKKNKTKGSNGSLSVGNTVSLFRIDGNDELHNKPTISLNYNYKKNKINFFTNAVYNYREFRSKLDIVSRYYRDGMRIDSTDNVTSTFRGRNNNYTLKTGLDFTPDKKNTYGVVFTGFMFDGRPHNTTYTTYTNLADVPFSRLNSYTSTQLSLRNIAGNFNFRHVYDSTGKEITLDLDYSKYVNTTDQLLSTGFFDGNYVKTADSMFLRGHLPATINIYSVKSDFVKPFKSGLKLEAGIKSSYVKSDNQVNYERKVPNGWVPDSRNNHFVYTENINAAYLNLNKKIKQWDVQTGLRAENTNTKGIQQSTNSDVTRSYVSLFPSVFLSRPVNKKNTITISASRRLQRPNYQDLNPFTYFLDSLSYKQGNPYLTPQFSYNYELTNNYRGKLITTLNYTKTTDVISNIINRKKGANNEIIGFLTSDNIAGYTNMGVAITAPVKLKKWWNANFYTNVYRNHYKGTYISNETGHSVVVPLDIAFTSFTLNINNSFTIGKGWTAELSGFYRYKTVEQLSLTYPTGQMSIGLAKNNLMKGRAALRLNARDPFNFQYYRGLTKYGTVDISIKNRNDNRQYGVNFTYRFGTSQGQSRRRASATEDEQRRASAGNGG